MALQDLRPRKLTYEDYVLIPEDGQRHEILDREHYVTPAPFIRHQRLSIRSTPWALLLRGPHRLGESSRRPPTSSSPSNDVVQPDLLFISNALARDHPTEQNVQGAPDLVVEILSTGCADTGRGDQARALRATGGGRVLAVRP